MDRSGLVDTRLSAPDQGINHMKVEGGGTALPRERLVHRIGAAMHLQLGVDGADVRRTSGMRSLAKTFTLVVPGRNAPDTSPSALKCASPSTSEVGLVLY